MVMPASYPESTLESFRAEGADTAWKNWSGNIQYGPLTVGQNYFQPTDRGSLEAIVRKAAAAGATLRVSGQRHSQPPLVVHDMRRGAAATGATDMAGRSRVLRGPRSAAGPAHRA